MINLLIFFTVFLTSIVFGIALVASIVVHPILLGIKKSSAIEIFKPFFNKTHIIILVFSLLATAIAFILSWMSGNWLWLCISLIMHINGPYTALGMMPLNRRLMAENVDPLSEKTNKDLIKWGKLHAFRTFLNGLTFILTLVILIWNT